MWFKRNLLIITAAAAALGLAAGVALAKERLAFSGGPEGGTF